MCKAARLGLVMMAVVSYAGAARAQEPDPVVGVGYGRDVPYERAVMVTRSGKTWWSVSSFYTDPQWSQGPWQSGPDVFSSAGQIVVIAVSYGPTLLTDDGRIYGASRDGIWNVIATLSPAVPGEKFVGLSMESGASNNAFSYAVTDHGTVYRSATVGGGWSIVRIAGPVEALSPSWGQVKLQYRDR
jgi:hypothetical protein